MIAGRLSRAGLISKRVLQTPKAFSNWPDVLVDMARARVGHGPDKLSFEARSGIRIECPNVPGARVPVYEIFAEDTYHLDWFLGPLASRPIQVLDIGAHVGTFSCRLAQVNSDATIQCFEPSATTADFLRRNVAQNGFGGRISVFQKALAAESGFAVFDDNGGGSGLNGLVKAGRTATSSSSTKVETVAFDQAVASAPAPIDLIKMDCEGGEYDLTYGSSRDSWSSVQRLVLEYHEVAGQTWDELCAWYGSVGLHVVKQEPVTRSLGTAWLSRGPVSG